jgi:GAF domain-containing protein
MPSASDAQLGVCLALTRALSRARSVDDIYSAALDAIATGMGVVRAAILLFDNDGVMRFKASHGLSEKYRTAVEGHTPWPRNSPDPQPIIVADVSNEPSLKAHRQTIEDEGITAMAFVPLVSLGRVIGKVMVSYDAPHALDRDELQFAGIVAAEVAFAIERTCAEQKAAALRARCRVDGHLGVGFAHSAR